MALPAESTTASYTGRLLVRALFISRLIKIHWQQKPATDIS
jgi:hypothetical protein